MRTYGQVTGCNAASLGSDPVGGAASAANFVVCKKSKKAKDGLGQPPSLEDHAELPHHSPARVPRSSDTGGGFGRACEPGKQVNINIYRYNYIYALVKN